ncbi:MAG: hypothetical protein ABTQ29_12765 [Siculibacillus sp.]
MSMREPATAAVGSGGRAASAAVAAAVFLVGAIGYLARATDLFQAVPGDLGDARFNAVVMEHGHLWLTGRVASLWDIGFFHPYPHVLGLSDTHLGTVAVYSAFRTLGLSREVSLDLWYVAGFGLDFLAAFHVLRRFAFSPAAAAIGAFVFTFGLPGLAQENDLQLTWRFAVPLAFLALVRAYEERRPALLLVVLAWTVVEFFCAIYLGIFLVYLLLATVAAFALIDRAGLVEGVREGARAARDGRWGLGVAASVALLVPLLWLLAHHAWASMFYGVRRPAWEITSMLPRPGSHFFAGDYRWSETLAGLLRGIAAEHEHRLFLGFGVLALAAVGLALLGGRGEERTRRVGRIAAVALALLVAFTLSIADHSLYQLVLRLPGINAIRSVTRIIVILQWPVAILVAFAVDRAVARVGGAGSARGAAAGLIALVAVAFEPATHVVLNTPIAVWRDRIEALRGRLGAPIEPGTVLWVRSVTGIRDGELEYALDAMILAQDLGVKTVNGYSGWLPIGLTDQFRCGSPDMPAERWAKFAGISIERARERLAGVRIVDVVPCATAEGVSGTRNP